MVDQIDLSTIFKETSPERKFGTNQDKIVTAINKIKRQTQDYYSLYENRANYTQEAQHDIYDHIKSVRDPTRLNLYNGELEKKKKMN